MAKKNGFDFEAIKNSMATQVAEQEIKEGFDELNKGGAQMPERAASREITATAAQQPVTVLQEPTQNINIPIPLSQHTRLQILKANRRQNIKQMVVEAIALWLDVQEGKKSINTNQQ